MTETNETNQRTGGAAAIGAPTRSAYIFGGVLLVFVFAYVGIPLVTGHGALLQVRFFQLMGFGLISALVAYIMFVLAQGSTAAVDWNTGTGQVFKAGGPIAGALFLFWLLTKAIPEPVGLTITLFKTGAGTAREQLGQLDGSTQVEVGSDVVSRVTTANGIASFPTLTTDQQWILRILNDRFKLKAIEPAKCMDQNNVVEVSPDCRRIVALLEPVSDCLVAKSFSAIAAGPTTLKAVLDSLLDGARVAGFSRAGITRLDRSLQSLGLDQQLVENRRFSNSVPFCEHVRAVQDSLQQATNRPNLRLLISCTEILVTERTSPSAPLPEGFQECTDSTK